MVQVRARKRLREQWQERAKSFAAKPGRSAAAKAFASHHFGGDIWWKLLVACGKVTHPMVR
eukprot:5656813-Alexandrium_andersonii.AAC.1